jgi:DNA-binding GntR family transcriptional regulator
VRITKAASLTDQVVEAIRQDIATGRLPPDSRHSVESLAKQLGVSRTPVREALVRLAEAHMVRFQPNVGVVVLKPTVRELEEILQLRLMLEPPAAYRAAERADETQRKELDEALDAMKQAVSADDDDRVLRFTEDDVRFHQLILEASGNNRLANLVLDLRYATMTLGVDLLLRDATRPDDASASASPRSLEDVMHDHEPVLEAIKHHDCQAAAAAMYRHVRLTGNMLLRRRAIGTSDAYDHEWVSGIADYGTGEEAIWEEGRYPRYAHD